MSEEGAVIGVFPLSGKAIAALALVVIAVGVGAGLGGMLLALLLHLIQHLAYGYSQDNLIGSETFLLGATAAAPERRVLVLVCCGLVAGVGWWLLYRYGRPLVGIKKALATEAPPMPVGATLIHALLQIITVALGSPLGREVAPREVGAVLAGSLARRARLDPALQRLLIACGAGAGLAAVYNVPLGGAVFVLEVLLGSFSWPAALIALSTSAIGAWVAWIGLGAEAQYMIPHYLVSTPLIAWAILSGPVLGVAAIGFVRLTTAARARAARGWRLPVLALINFSLIGLLAIFLPQILGNGKGPAQLGFDDQLGLGMAATLMLCKVLVTTTTLRAGAEGGLLTPGLAVGALLATLLGGAWSHFLPGLPLGACAIVGAAAFLGASMSMPLTAIVLIMEFTRLDHDFLVPLILAVVGAFGVVKLWEWRGL